MLGNFALPKRRQSVDHVRIVGVTEIPKAIEENLTVIVRKFEHFENDVSGTVESFLSLYPNLRVLIVKIQKRPTYLVSAAFQDTRAVECLKVNLNAREWYIEYSTTEDDVCDSVSGNHAILVATETIKKLPVVFMLPFPEALYIQAAAQNIKVKLLRQGGLTEGQPLYKSSHAYWKLQQLHQRRLKDMYREFGLKKVVRETGVVEWYGCNRNTARCFGTVVDDIPQYLWEGKWTPPCCLAGLRRTARHVFDQLDESGVRYWLEGGSLLGAMRSSDILPWDYDVDLGFYRDDISRCHWLLRAQKQSIIDSDGFVWEKAPEGEFFRVQYSQSNHLHVDLFPFYEVNGTMTKDTWFPTHKQDREFPEYFLHPMSSIEFIGRQVPAPNNIRDFLELKFGKNVIENPEYPNPSKLKFSMAGNLPP
ncbi:Fukutin-related protein [Gryllus bimaculatus]|nr:Fukutin-related protein [Gryllus bimaculatus]